jgi:hypothetical protein
MVMVLDGRVCGEGVGVMCRMVLQGTDVSIGVDCITWGCRWGANVWL